MALMNRFRIGTKITGTLLFVLVCTLALVGLSLTALSQLDARIAHIVDVSEEKVKLAANLRGSLFEVAQVEKDVILATSHEDRAELAKRTDVLLADIVDRQSRLAELVDTRGAELLSGFDGRWQAYLAIDSEVRGLVEKGAIAEATALSTGEGQGQLDLAAAALQEIVARNDADMDLDRQLGVAEFVRARNRLVAGSIFAVAVGLALGLTIPARITASLRAMLRVAQGVSEGDLTQEAVVASRDEIGELGEAFNRSIDYLRETAGIAARIAGGDLATDFAPSSERDVLRNALHEMMFELRRMTTVHERRVWQATGQSGLSDTMRGELSVVVMAQNVITYLCRYLGAQIGALYVDGKDESLKLVSSYAYTRRKGLSDQFRVGEGVVGQCALEMQPIVLSDVPEDYIRVQSGLGDARPKHLLVVPFVHEGRVGGVVELGRFSEWTDADVDFVTQLGESIAVSLQMSESRAHVLELLEQTQRQAEELQMQTEELGAQQEELRQTNEELRQQTQALEDSQRDLQTQQEELRATNEELTEKTHMLEQQRIEVEGQNRALTMAQEELQRRAQELALASKYKSEFLSNMSHELRTPLNSMLILAHLLAENEEGNLTGEQVESAQVVYESGQDLLALINDILDLAKVEAGRMDRHAEPVELAGLLEDIERDFSHVAGEKGLDLRTRLDDGLPATIHTDRKRLEQILKNLLSNALKFTAEGSVTVRIHRPEADLPISLRERDRAHLLAFGVTDTGIGISPEDRERIFEAFQQVDGSISRAYGGTGLGLSISRELASFLDGEIDVESALGTGSTFTLYLPESIEASIPTVPVISAVPAAMVSERPAPDTAAVVTLLDDRNVLTDDEQSLLIIEDDPNFARVLYRLAHERGFKGIVAADGESGLELARQYHPAAIILDLMLPHISGWDVLARIKDDPDMRHIPVHIISGQNETMTAFQWGAMGYLTKPVDSAELNQAFERIEAFLERRVRTLLIVDDDIGTRKALRKLIGDGDVGCVDVASAKEALAVLRSRPVDCLILDLRLPGMSGFDLLDELERDVHVTKPPIIVYTGKDLTREENEHLIKYADTVIVKGIKSEERLLDETSLFLHRVIAELPAGKQRIIRRLHDLEMVFDGKKLLLVDDDVRNAFALSRLLNEKGLTVEIATDGQKALEILSAQADIDLVLMDVMLPGMDGLEVIRRIREQRKFVNLPILAVTAKAMRGDREDCLAAGANDYLPKPVDVERLLSMLRVWLYR